MSVESKTSSALLSALKDYESKLTPGPWFYEPGIPEGGDRTGSVWAMTGHGIELVMSKPHVAQAILLAELRNSLPEIIEALESNQDQEQA